MCSSPVLKMVPVTYHHRTGDQGEEQELLLRRYGTVESVRLRSLPLKDEGKLPRRAAVAAGAVDESRGSANAYVVFSSGASAVHALAHNMREVRISQTQMWVCF
jgi:hypothetical protein